MKSSLKQSVRQHNSYSAFFNTKPDARRFSFNCTRWTYESHEKQSLFCFIQYLEIVHLSISANFLLEIILTVFVTALYHCIVHVKIAVAFSSAFLFASQG